ncbi:peptidase S58 DmpA [Dethiosulfovibrio peptidovorans DSM 11002]|uniref:Peptidase S58 DmpA n=1 Tax=Dethiosulfovibrio peptidovorans DSM 11002 TaxID=469381 RepID=D2Z7E9_9BACT|nr:P1 family peptidase [Dethiosulfovibrio peptidovorans]EFC91396.1 peptidase S58 DmpA [Dethiosulfovibrio peptidovorans DSM 11002]
MVRAREMGIEIGFMPTGAKNSIGDVQGVSVGHVTLDDGPVKTGVTAIIPGSGNTFRHKFPAGCHVINGFGKSVGLVQIEELGTLETPIVLTNTLSVGDCVRGLVDEMLATDEGIGDTTGTVNSVVCECNDGFLNDIRGLNVKPRHVGEAVRSASPNFSMGDVGAGKGMSCYQLKGGIGSSSRLVELDGARYTVGVLVLSNFGEMKDLSIDGVKVGKAIFREAPPERLKEQGSIIAVVATDAPMTSRQLKRLCKRASVGIVRTGAYIGNGSGEIALAFSTAYRVPHEGVEPVEISPVSDSLANRFFRAVVEATEESVIDSMLLSSPVEGREGRKRRSLAEFEEHIIGRYDRC